MPNICNIEFSQPHCTSREYGPSFHQMGETCPHSVHRLTLRILSCRFAFGLTLMLALLETFPLLDANPVCKERGVIPHIFMTNMPYSTTPTPPICISHDGHQRPIQWLGEADAIAIRYSNVTTRLESTQDLDRTCGLCSLITTFHTTARHPGNMPVPFLCQVATNQNATGGAAPSHTPLLRSIVLAEKHAPSRATNDIAPHGRTQPFHTTG
jgi:hypothetical protein